MDIERLNQLQEKPIPFTPGEPLFWDDPHISKGMLAAHLDPSTDLASRRPHIIEKMVAWLVESLDLQPGQAVLDLGCGPGLYAARFAQHGLSVTGVDISPRSIDYAKKYAFENNLEIEYRVQNYLELYDRDRFDAAFLIYGDFCPLPPEKRVKLLSNLRRALKPGGFFVLDVSTRIHRHKYGNKNGWHALQSGFWKPGPHLVLEEGFDYPEQSIYLDQAIVIEANGQISVYRNWFQDYTPETISAELESNGFAVRSIWSDLAGTPYNDKSEWIGVITQKPI